MSLADKRDITFAEISRFLAHHTDFFVEHPELLQQVAIPHDLGSCSTGNNVSSLLEYQVNHLQKQVRSLEKNNAYLKDRMEKQHELVRQMHDFVLQIMQTQTADKLYALLQKGLRIYYAADRLVILVFNRGDILARHADMRFLDAGTPLAFMFTEIFHRRKPLCNSLQEEHLEALFNYGTADIQSTVILPMTENNHQSLMVLGSYDKNRYQHGSELDLLFYFSQMVHNHIDILLK